MSSEDNVDFDDILALPSEPVPTPVAQGMSLEAAKRKALGDLQQLDLDIARVQREVDTYTGWLSDPARAENAHHSLASAAAELAELEAKRPALELVRDKTLAVFQQVEAAEALRAAAEHRRANRVAVEQCAADRERHARAVARATTALVDALHGVYLEHRKAAAAARAADLDWPSIEKHFAADLVLLGAWGIVERARIDGKLPCLPPLFAYAAPVPHFNGAQRILGPDEYARLQSAGLTVLLAEADGVALDAKGGDA